MTSETTHRPGPVRRCFAGMLYWVSGLSGSSGLSAHAARGGGHALGLPEEIKPDSFRIAFQVALLSKDLSPLSSCSSPPRPPIPAPHVLQSLLMICLLSRDLYRDQTPVPMKHVFASTSCYKFFISPKLQPLMHCRSCGKKSAVMMTPHYAPDVSMNQEMERSESF